MAAPPWCKALRSRPPQPVKLGAHTLTDAGFAEVKHLDKAVGRAAVGAVGEADPLTRGPYLEHRICYLRADGEDVVQDRAAVRHTAAAGPPRNEAATAPRGSWQVLR
jgi:hypothetical protein